jgi:hypothetical protein
MWTLKRWMVVGDMSKGVWDPAAPKTAPGRHTSSPEVVRVGPRKNRLAINGLDRVARQEGSPKRTQDTPPNTPPTVENELINQSQYATSQHATQRA